MTGLLIMIPVSLVLGLIFLRAFFWSSKNGDIESSEYLNSKILWDNEDDVDHEIGRNSNDNKSLVK